MPLSVDSTSRFVLLNPEATVPDELRRDGMVLSWSELEAIGRAESGKEVEELERAQAANQVRRINWLLSQLKNNFGKCTHVCI